MCRNSWDNAKCAGRGINPLPAHLAGRGVNTVVRNRLRAAPPGGIADRQQERKRTDEWGSCRTCCSYSKKIRGRGTQEMDEYCISAAPRSRATPGFIPGVVLLHSETGCYGIMPDLLDDVDGNGEIEGILAI